MERLRFAITIVSSRECKTYLGFLIMWNIRENSGEVEQVTKRLVI